MDNVSVVSYLPYKEYIPQMDYVIHHGGAGIFTSVSSMASLPDSPLMTMISMTMQFVG